MLFLPKILYLFRTIPLEFGKVWFKQIEGMFNRFIWLQGKTRRALRYMTLTRERGDWGVPDIRFYYWASVLQYIRTLLISKSAEQTVQAGFEDVYELLIGDTARGCFLCYTEPGYYKKVRFKTLQAAFKICTSLKR